MQEDAEYISMNPSIPLEQVRNRASSDQEVCANAEVWVDTSVATTTRSEANRPEIVIHDKKKEVEIIEVGVRSQDELQVVESGRRRK